MLPGHAPWLYAVRATPCIYAQDNTKDEKGNPVFPFADGKPTFRPSAAWFAAQFELSNVVTTSFWDTPKVIKVESPDPKPEGAQPGDLRIQMRFEGTFRETMELYDFPFDTQARHGDQARGRSWLVGSCGLGIHLQLPHHIGIPLRCRV